MMKKPIAVLTSLLLALLALANGSAATAGCCSLGGTSSNFLGDSAMNIDMLGHDEFLKQSLVSSSLSVQNSPGGSKSRMSLNLNDTRSVYLILSRTGANLTGEGSMKGFNGTETLLAVGSLSGNAVSLNINASSGGMLEFSLAAEGSSVAGEFNETLADGRTVQGEAIGKWMPE